MLFSIIESVSGAIRDSGPYYHEFHADAFIKEPWNAYSSLFFLVPVLFWVWKLRGQYAENKIITAILPLLFLNGIGSALYHAFRSSEFFMILDGLPAMLMVLILSGYMWNKVLNNIWKSIAVVLLFYVTGISAIISLKPSFGDGVINLSYLFSGACFLVPAMIILFRTKYYKWPLILMTFIFLGLALLFRSLDYPTPNLFSGIFPQGTHFLWHIMSALAVFSLGYYIYFIKNMDLQKQNRLTLSVKPNVKSPTPAST
jgi:hypothetical protein